MYLCVFEDDQVAHFAPLSSTRPVYDLRLGIRTLLESIGEAFSAPPTLLHSRRYLADVTRQELDLVVNQIPDGLDVLFVNGRYIPEEGPVLDRLRAATRDGAEARLFLKDGEVVAAWVPNASTRYVEQDEVSAETFEGLAVEEVDDARLISRLWHLLDELPGALLRDYSDRTKGRNILHRPGAEIRDGAVLVEDEQVFVAPGAVVQPGAVLNAETGPIYIDADAEIMEQAVIRGPAYIGPRCKVKVGANIEESAIGFYCKVSGEISCTIFHSLSNKAHSGHMGDAYLGRWCNIGADTNNSNLKNNYGIVTVHDSVSQEFESSGRQFAGLFMGDHSKCGINTMFNTGTVIGVSCNLYGADFQPRYVPSFSWGGPGGMTEYRLDKALEVAEAVMARRDTSLTAADREMLTHVFEATKGEREA